LTEANKVKQRFSGYGVVAGCLIVLTLSQGGMNALGLFVPEISESTGLPYSAVVFFTTIAAFGAFAISTLTGKLLGGIGAKATLAIAAIAAPLHMILLSVAANQIAIYIAGVIAAIGLGLLFAPVSAIITKWFINKRSTMIGLVFSGSGFGGAIVLPVAGQLIAAFGWRGAYQILALATAAIMIPAIVFLVKNSPESIGQKPLGYEKTTLPQEFTSQDQNAAISGIDATAAMRSVSYWLILIGIACSGFLVTGLVVSLPTFWRQSMDPLAVSNWMGLFSILGAGGIILAGILAGKFGTKAYLLYTTASFIIGLLILITGTVELLPVFVALVLIGLAYPLLSVTPPLTTVDAFGKKDYDKLIGPFQGVIQCGAGTSVLLTGIIADSTGSFIPAFIMLIIMAIVGVVLTLVGLTLAPLKNKSL
jgi:MFS family permease